MLAAAPGHDHGQRHLAEGRGDSPRWKIWDTSGRPPFLEEEMGVSENVV